MAYFHEAFMLGDYGNFQHEIVVLCHVVICRGIRDRNKEEQKTFKCGCQIESLYLRRSSIGLHRKLKVKRKLLTSSCNKVLFACVDCAFDFKKENLHFAKVTVCMCQPQL